MNYRNATTAGVGVGVFGVSVTALTTALLFLVPQSFTTTAARDAYIDAWSVPIMTVGESVLIVGIPLLSAVLAYVLTNDGHSLQRALTGFVVGGVVFGLGVALLGETVMLFFADDPALGRSLVSHLFDVVERGGRVVAGAFAGVLCAHVAERR